MRKPKPQRVGNGEYLIKLWSVSPETGKRVPTDIFIESSLQQANMVSEQLVRVRKLGLLESIDLDAYVESLLSSGRKLDVNAFVRKPKVGEAVDSPLLKEHLSTWLDSDTVRGLAFKTRDSYRYQLERYVIPELGELPLAHLTKEHIRTFLDGMVRTRKTQKGKKGKNGKRQPLSRRTKKYTLTILASALESGVGIYWPVNPARGIVLERLEHEKEDEVVNAMDVGQMRAYRRALGDDTLSLLLLFLLLTGARPGEALALRKKHLRDRTVEIRKTATRLKGDVRIKDPKTKRGKRSVTIPHHLAQALAKLAADKKANDFLFADPTGLPFWLSTVRAHHKRVLEAAGIEFSFRLYDLRHTHATFLLMKRHSPHVVSRRLGHRDVATTLTSTATCCPTWSCRPRTTSRRPSSPTTPRTRVPARR